MIPPTRKSPILLTLLPKKGGRQFCRWAQKRMDWGGEKETQREMHKLSIKFVRILLHQVSSIYLERIFRKRARGRNAFIFWDVFAVVFFCASCLQIVFAWNSGGELNFLKCVQNFVLSKANFASRRELPGPNSILETFGPQQYVFWRAIRSLQQKNINPFKTRTFIFK